MRKALAFAALMMAGCAPAAQTTEEPAKPGGVAQTVQSEHASEFTTCQDAADHYGAKAGEALQAPIPYKLYRVIPPNSAVTLDYNPERLNVYTDDDGFITKARCG